jgi:hypothetical protein
MRRTYQDLTRAAGIHDVVTHAISGHATETTQQHYSTARSPEIRDALARVAGLALGPEAPISTSLLPERSAPRRTRPHSKASDQVADSSSLNRLANGAGEGIRTLDVNLGKVALYH